jgi:hypothetical protein
LTPQLPSSTSALRSPNVRAVEESSRRHTCEKTVEAAATARPTRVGAPARAELAEHPFGGLRVLYIGDFAQLAPVGDTSCLSDGANASPIVASGLHLYRTAFARSFHFTQSFRQVGADEGQRTLRDMIERARTGDFDQRHIDLLNTRTRAALLGQNGVAGSVTNPIERQRLERAIGLFATRKSALEFNYKRLRELGQPVLRLKARHEGGSAAKRKPAKDADGLEPELVLSRGARVMVTANVWTKRGAPA